MTTRSYKVDGRPGFQGNDVRPVTRAGWIDLPAGLDLGKSFMLATALHEPCLIAYPKQNEDNVIDIIVSPATEIALTPRNRFTPPPELLKHAELEPGKSRAIFAGVGRRVEIWNKENWDNWIKNIELDDKNLPNDFRL